MAQKQMKQQPYSFIQNEVEPKTATAGSGATPPSRPPTGGNNSRYDGGSNKDNRMHHHRGYGDENYGRRSADLFDLQREAQKMGKKPLDVGETYPLGRAGDR